MKKHPLKYIKAYGIKIYFYEAIILFFNKFKIAKNTKEKLVIKKNKIINFWLEDNYKKLIEKYVNIKIRPQKNSNKIWIFWWQGNKHMPELVKICIESINRNISNKEIILLSKENISNYIKLPQYILEKFETGKIGTAHFSDIIRVGLLKEYGGTWIDATIYLSKKISNKEFEKIKTIKFKCNDDTSISNGLWCCFFLNRINYKLYSFLYEFYLDYWEKEDIIIDYFLLDFMIKIAYQHFPEVKKDIDNNEYNNEQIHKLASLLNNKFNQDEYETLLESNFIHKLSYKIELQEKFNNQPTYWGIIKNGGYDEK